MEENSPSSYKQTLNLLKTSFGMRANAARREPELQAFWKEKGIDFKLGLNNTGPIFTLHDGPPYANGDLHMGHALNKILKDIINKYKILKGNKVIFVPGWDCHGLPIELKVLQQLKSKDRAELNSIQLRKKASNYAKKQVDSQMKGFKRWGVWADWEKPYLTLNKQYEASQIHLFGEMIMKGYIYRGLKPVHWSPSSQTALAEAELEYPEGHVSTSIYVSFPVEALTEKLRQNLLEQGLELPLDSNKLSQKLKLIIWTTTPWTLPANLAISVNDRLDYVIASSKKEEYVIVAKELLGQLSDLWENQLHIVSVIKGGKLEGILYKNPILDRRSKVLIGGDYINTESGTGLVHTAPGHGLDDFNTGIKYDLPILCPVDERGNFTSEAYQFEGLNVLKDANQVIIEALKSSKALIKEEQYHHKYPYDWRTKKPTIFRATQQWFASLEGFRGQAINAIDSVEWLPSSGSNRIRSMVSERGDWCISRQRTWGVPIPVFYDKNNGEVLVNQETLSHIELLISKHGSDIWWELDESDLLPSSYSDQSDRWRKGTDTMDVWFDSGSSWSGVLNNLDVLNFPADLYLEGSDQHRGWFQSSLLTSVAVEGKAPFKKVLTHGFALDDKGRKMSKSLGNVIDPKVIIDGGKNQKEEPAYGADVLRLWVSSVDYSSDVPIGSAILRQLSDVYRKVRNTARYLLGNLHDYEPSIHQVDVDKLPLLDRWMVDRTASFIKDTSRAFEEYEFSRFFQQLQSFCVSDLSNFYLDIAKDRLYVSAPDDYRRRTCQTVLSLVVENLACVISPVLCHMAEDIWQNLPYKVSQESVFENKWPELDSKLFDNSLAEPIAKLRELRSSVNKALEDCRSKNEIGASLQSAVRLEPKDESLLKAIKWLELNGNVQVDILKDWLLVSELQIGGSPWEDLILNETNLLTNIQIAKARGRKCDRCWHFKIDVGTNTNNKMICNRCEKILSSLND